MLNDVAKRLEQLENRRNEIPWAVVSFEDGRTERHSLSWIARAFFDKNPDGITGVSWVSGNTAGVIFQLLACNDFWMEVKKPDDTN